MSSQRASGSGRGRGKARTGTAARPLNLSSPQQQPFVFAEPVSQQPAQSGYMTNSFTGLLSGENIGAYSSSEFDEYGSGYGYGYNVPVTPAAIDVDENSPDVEEVEEINEEDVVEPSRGRKGKQPAVKLEGDGRKWDPYEDIILSKAWCNLTERVYDTRSDGFWLKVQAVYNDEVKRQGGLPRSIRPMQNRWGKAISKQGQIWYAADRHVRSKIKSGENEAKILQRITTTYMVKNPLGTPFQFMHVIDILMGCQKFIATCASSITKSLYDMDVDTSTPPTDGGSSAGSSAVKRSIDSSNATDEATSPMKEAKRPMKETIRPPGVKATKAKKQMEFNESPANQERLKMKAEVRAAEFDLERMRIEKLADVSTQRTEQMRIRAESTRLKLEASNNVAALKLRAQIEGNIEKMKASATSDEELARVFTYENHMRQKWMHEDMNM